MNKCPRYEEAEKKNLPEFKTKATVCFVCKKAISQVLDLHHTNADLCSYECEKNIGWQYFISDHNKHFKQNNHFTAIIFLFIGSRCNEIIVYKHYLFFNSSKNTLASLIYSSAFLSLFKAARQAITHCLKRRHRKNRSYSSVVNDLSLV